MTASARYSRGALSADFPIWGLFGRSLLMVIGQFLVIPRRGRHWSVSLGDSPTFRCRGGPISALPGSRSTIWYGFIVLGLMAYAELADSTIVSLLSLALQAFLQWMIVRWFVSRLSFGTDKEIPLSFAGSPAVYIGWYALDGDLGHHDHRLGLGADGLDALDLPQHRRARAARSLSMRPDSRCCGEPS